MKPKPYLFKTKVASACVLSILAGHGLPALAAAGGPETIQPSAVAQIRAILAEKAARTPAEEKLDSNLLYGVRAVASGKPGAVAAQPQFVQDFVRGNFAADATVELVITAKVTDALLAALQAAGATDITPFPQYDTVTAKLPADQVLKIAELPEVRFIKASDPHATNRYDLTAEQQSAWLANAGLFGAIPTGPITNVGAATSQGVVAHAANKVQQTGITGAGQKVCVLSDGVNSLAGRQATGDLPASVDVVSGQAGNGDEGTAMLEIVYDMAPGVALGFASSGPSQAQMATNIQTLRNSPHNCTVIVDDITFFAEPPFQEGTIAQAVTTVSTSGAPYFSSAANSGSKLKGTSGTWEGDFVNSGTTIGALPETGQIHSFGGSNTNTLSQATYNGWPYLLNWGDPQSGSSNDYDLFVLNSSLTSVLGQSTTRQTGSQPPIEGIGASASIPSGSKFVIVNYHSLAATRALRLDTSRGRLSINTNGSTFGHNGGVNTITMAAVDVAMAGGGVFTGGALNPVETFSSDGPRRLFYTAAGAAITPGNVLFGTNGGTLLNKVDLTAADGVTTTTPNFIPFYGTSAAAPHAAAIAALVKSAKPSLTVAQVKAALVAGALDIETAGYDYTTGAGLIRADLAVKSVLTAIGKTKVFAPASISVGGTSVLTYTFTNSNAVALKGIALSDTYPANVKTAATPAASFTGTGCVGTVTAAAGGGSVALSNATIPAGGTCTLKVNVTSSVAGTYTYTGGLLTTPIGLNTAASSATLTVTAALKPDFVVTGIVLNPVSPIIKSTFSATVTVKNQGTASGNAGYVDVWANQPAAQTCPADGNGFALVGTLAAGASKTVVITGLDAGLAGAKTLRAFVDSSCLTAETDEGNNQFTLSYKVDGGPDFVVTSVTPIVPVGGIKAKSAFSATVVIKNQGAAAGDGGFVDVWANQPATQTCPADGNKFASVGTLAAGASKTLTIVGLPAGAAGAKTLRAYVDSYCQTPEANDGNNQTTSSYTVVP